MTVPVDQRIRFAQFEIDPDARAVFRGGVRLKLQQLPFEVLMALLERPGRLVTREELRGRIWGADTFVDFDHSLNIAVNKLRAALQDAAEAPRLIETIPKAGYRFVGVLSPPPAAAAAAGATTARDSRGPRRSPPRQRWVALALALAAVGGAGLWRASGRTSPSQPGAGAREEYLLGRAAWNVRTEASLREAIAHFVRATALAPEYAAAYAGLADSYTTLAYLTDLQPADGFGAARAAAERALRLDDALADAHASLGYVHLYYDWDWAAADRELRRAIAVDPGYALAHQWYAVYLTAMGRPGEAQAEVRRAREIDPLSAAIATDVGFQLYYTRQYDEAEETLRGVLDAHAAFPLAHLWLGRTYQQQHRLDEALTEFAAVDRTLPEWPVSIAAIGSAQAMAGHRTEALATLARLQALSRRRYVTEYGVALIYAALGDADRANDWLERGVAARTPWLVWLKLDPRWGTMARSARFAQIASHVGLP